MNEIGEFITHRTLSMLSSFNTAALREEYQKSATKAFSHLQLESFLEPTWAQKAYEEMMEWVDSERAQAVKYSGKTELNKFTENRLEYITKGRPHLGKIFEFFRSKEGVQFIREATGIYDLMPDPLLTGGGLHCTENGHLDLHQDFTILPSTKHLTRRWQRKVNIILYLNKSWTPENLGQLELWSNLEGKTPFEDKPLEKIASIDPIFNRAVIFDTERSWHGQPVDCKGLRLSLALYFYRVLPEGTHPAFDCSTIYAPREDVTEEERRKRGDGMGRYDQQQEFFSKQYGENWKQHFENVYNNVSL